MGTATWNCSWRVWVPSGDPEPDVEYGLGGVYIEAECGAAAYELTDPETGEVDGWECEAGHRHFTYGSRRQQIEERTEALMEERY